MIGTMLTADGLSAAGPGRPGVAVTVPVRQCGRRSVG